MPRNVPMSSDDTRRSCKGKAKAGDDVEFVWRDHHFKFMNPVKVEKVNRILSLTGLVFTVTDTVGKQRAVDSTWFRKENP